MTSICTFPKGDFKWLTERAACPDCQSQLWNRGPEGGMSFNIRCAGCQSKFCFCGPLTPMRINNSDQVYDIQPRSLEYITGYNVDQWN